MRLVNDPRIRTWYVGFSDSTNGNFWYEPLMKKGFKHCYAFAWDKTAGVWIIFEPGFGSVVVRALSIATAEAFFSRIQGRDTILKYKIEDYPNFVTRLFNTCSTSIAHLLGVNIFIPTVYPLYCALRKKGATVSFLSR